MPSDYPRRGVGGVGGIKELDVGKVRGRYVYNDMTKKRMNDKDEDDDEKKRRKVKKGMGIRDRGE